MFPDSNIAQQFNQKEAKAKYTIQFGIAQYAKEKLILDVSRKPFSFKFDQTTTSQIKKQYDAYITSFFYTNQVIATAFCGSLFVYHCTAEDLLSHFLNLLRDLGLKLSLYCHLEWSFADKLKATVKPTMLHHLLILAAVHFILQIMFFLKDLNF